MQVAPKPLVSVEAYASGVVTTRQVRLLCRVDPPVTDLKYPRELRAVT